MVLTPFGSIHYWTLRRFRAVAGNLTHKIKSSKSRPADVPSLTRVVYRDSKALDVSEGFVIMVIR